MLRRWTSLPGRRAPGLNEAWVPEHHGAADGYAPSPLGRAGGDRCAHQDNQTRFGNRAGASVPPRTFRGGVRGARHPVQRPLEMAVAIGYRRREAEAYGADFSTRGRRTDEFLEIVRRLWAGETFSFEGKHFNLKNAVDCSLPKSRTHTALSGRITDKAMERTAKYGDGYFGNMEFVTSTQRSCAPAARIRPVRESASRDCFVLVANDPEKAMHEVAPYFHYVNNAYGEWLNEDRASRVSVILRTSSR